MACIVVKSVNPCPRYILNAGIGNLFAILLPEMPYRHALIDSWKRSGLEVSDSGDCCQSRTSNGPVALAAPGEPEYSRGGENKRPSDGKMNLGTGQSRKQSIRQS